VGLFIDEDPFGSKPVALQPKLKKPDLPELRATQWCDMGGRIGKERIQVV
jgi:hypothetical protein